METSQAGFPRSREVIGFCMSAKLLHAIDFARRRLAQGSNKNKISMDPPKMIPRRIFREEVLQHDIQILFEMCVALV
jgi:hypothetical protein